MSKAKDVQLIKHAPPYGFENQLGNLSDDVITELLLRSSYNINGIFWVICFFVLLTAFVNVSIFLYATYKLRPHAQTVLLWGGGDQAKQTLRNCARTARMFILFFQPSITDQSWTLTLGDTHKAGVTIVINVTEKSASVNVMSTKKNNCLQGTVAVASLTRSPTPMKLPAFLKKLPLPFLSKPRLDSYALAVIKDKPKGRTTIFLEDQELCSLNYCPDTNYSLVTSETETCRIIRKYELAANHMTYSGMLVSGRHVCALIGEPEKTDRKFKITFELPDETFLAQLEIDAAGKFFFSKKKFEDKKRPWGTRCRSFDWDKLNMIMVSRMYRDEYARVFAGPPGRLEFVTSIRLAQLAHHAALFCTFNYEVQSAQFFAPPPETDRDYLFPSSVRDAAFVQTQKTKIHEYS